MTNVQCGATSCVYNRGGRCTARDIEISNEEGGITCLTYEPNDSEPLNPGGAPVLASGGGSPESLGGPSSTPISSEESSGDVDEFLRLMGG